MGIAIRHGKTAARTVPPGLPEPPLYARINCLAGHLDPIPPGCNVKPGSATTV